MKQIPLTQGKFALVDDEDFEWLNQWKWYTSKIGNSLYAVRKEGRGVSRTKIYMHRLIIDVPVGKYIDHIDGNGINNQRNNLRICTNIENSRNSRRRKDNSSGYKGVYWNNVARKFQAYIRVNGERKYLGTFIDIEDAARAYDMAAIENFGEFAKLNLEAGK